MRIYPQFILWTYVLLPAISLLLSPTLILSLARAQTQKAKLMANAINVRARAAAALAKNQARSHQKRLLPNSRFSNGMGQKPFKLRTVRDVNELMDTSGYKIEPRSHWDQQEESMGQLQNMWNMNGFGNVQNDGVLRHSHMDADGQKESNSIEEMVESPRIYNDKRHQGGAAPYTGAFFGRNVYDDVVAQEDPFSDGKIENGLILPFEKSANPEPTRKRKKNKKQMGQNYYYSQNSYSSYYPGRFYYGRSNDQEESPFDAIQGPEFQNQVLGDTIPSSQYYPQNSYGSFYTRSNDQGIPPLDLEEMAEFQDDQTIDDLIPTIEKSANPEPTLNKKNMGPSYPYPQPYYRGSHYDRSVEDESSQFEATQRPEGEVLMIGDPVFMEPKIVDSKDHHHKRSKKKEGKSGGHHFHGRSNENLEVIGATNRILPEEMISNEPNLMAANADVGMPKIEARSSMDPKHNHDHSEDVGCELEDDIFDKKPGEAAPYNFDPYTYYQRTVEEVADLNKKIALATQNLIPHPTHPNENQSAPIIPQLQPQVSYVNSGEDSDTEDSSETQDRSALGAIYSSSINQPTVLEGKSADPNANPHHHSHGFTHTHTHIHTHQKTFGKPKDLHSSSHGYDAPHPLPLYPQPHGYSSKAEAHAKSQTFGHGGIQNSFSHANSKSQSQGYVPPGAFGIAGAHANAQAHSVAGIHPGYGQSGGQAAALANAESQHFNSGSFGQSSAQANAQHFNGGDISQAGAQAHSQALSHSGFGTNSAQAAAQASTGAQGTQQFFQVLGPSNFVNARSHDGVVDQPMEEGRFVMPHINEIPVRDTLNEMEAQLGRFPRSLDSSRDALDGLNLASSIVDSSLGGNDNIKQDQKAQPQETMMSFVKDVVDSSLKVNRIDDDSKTFEAAIEKELKDDKSFRPRESLESPADVTFQGISSITDIVNRSLRDKKQVVNENNPLHRPTNITNGVHFNEVATETSDNIKNETTIDAIVGQQGPEDILQTSDETLEEPENEEDPRKPGVKKKTVVGGINIANQTPTDVLGATIVSKADSKEVPGAETTETPIKVSSNKPTINYDDEMIEMVNPDDITTEHVTIEPWAANWDYVNNREKFPHEILPKNKSEPSKVNEEKNFKEKPVHPGDLEKLHENTHKENSLLASYNAQNETHKLEAIDSNVTHENLGKGDQKINSMSPNIFGQNPQQQKAFLEPANIDNAEDLKPYLSKENPVKIEEDIDTHPEKSLVEAEKPVKVEQNINNQQENAFLGAVHLENVEGLNPNLRQENPVSIEGDISTISPDIFRQNTDEERTILGAENHENVLSDIPAVPVRDNNGILGFQSQWQPSRFDSNSVKETSKFDKLPHEKVEDDATLHEEKLGASQQGMKKKIIENIDATVNGLPHILISTESTTNISILTPEEIEDIQFRIPDDSKKRNDTISPENEIADTNKNATETFADNNDDNILGMSLNKDGEDKVLGENIAFNTKNTSRLVFNVSGGPFASIEAEMNGLTDEQKDIFIKQEMDLISEVIRETLENDERWAKGLRVQNRTRESNKNDTVASPHLFQVFDHDTNREDFERHVRAALPTDQSFDAILGAHKNKVDSIQREATDDSDLLMISFIGDSVIKDLEDRRKQAQQKNTPETITKPTEAAIKINKREVNDWNANHVPITRLISDPTTKIDVPKTLENVGAVVRHSFENSRAPIYHLRSMLGNTKNTVMSAAKIPPNNFLVPSEYEVVQTHGRNDENQALGAINQQMLISRSSAGNAAKTAESGAPDSLGIGDAFEKIRAMVEESVRSGKKVVLHINDAATDARNILYTAKHAAPRLIVPGQIPAVATRSGGDLSGATPNSMGKKAILITPRLLDVQENIVGAEEEQPNQFVGMGHILDAVGFTKPNQPEAELEKIVLEPSAIDVMKQWDRPKELRSSSALKTWVKDSLKKDPNADDNLLGAQEPQDTLGTLDEAKKSVGATSLKEFFNKMHQEMKEILTSQHEERKRKLKEKAQKTSLKKDQKLLKKKPTRKTVVPIEGPIQKPGPIVREADTKLLPHKTKEDDATLPPEIIKIFIEDVPTRNSVNENFKQQRNRQHFLDPTEDEVPTRSNPQDENVGFYLVPELMKPFMGQPSGDVLHNFLRENGDEIPSDDSKRLLDQNTIAPDTIATPTSGQLTPLNLRPSAPQPALISESTPKKVDGRETANEQLIRERAMPIKEPIQKTHSITQRKEMIDRSGNNRPQVTENQTKIYPITPLNTNITIPMHGHLAPADLSPLMPHPALKSESIQIKNEDQFPHHKIVDKEAATLPPEVLKEFTDNILQLDKGPTQKSDALIESVNLLIPDQKEFADNAPQLLPTETLKEFTNDDPQLNFTMPSSIVPNRGSIKSSEAIVGSTKATIPYHKIVDEEAAALPPEVLKQFTDDIPQLNFTTRQSSIVPNRDPTQRSDAIIGLTNPTIPHDKIIDKEAAAVPPEVSKQITDIPQLNFVTRQGSMEPTREPIRRSDALVELTDPTISHDKTIDEEAAPVPAEVSQQITDNIPKLNLTTTSMVPHGIPLQKSKSVENQEKLIQGMHQNPHDDGKSIYPTLNREERNHNLDYILGAPNPMMFERYYNENLRSTQPMPKAEGMMGSTIGLLTGNPNDTRKHELRGEIDGTNTKIAREEEPNEKDSNGRTSMKIIKQYQKPFMGYIRHDRVHGFLNQYNNYFPEDDEPIQNKPTEENDGDPFKNVVFSDEDEDYYNFAM